METPLQDSKNFCCNDDQKAHFDTCHAIMVRRAVVLNDNIDNLNINLDIMNTWKQARASFLEEIKRSKIDYDLVLQVFRKVWQSLSQINVDNPIYLPPLYFDSDVLTNLLQRFMGELVSRENGALLQSGNIVLNGVEGTGKTTILKAMVILVAICCEKFFFIYHNFENGLFTSDQLILEFVERFKTANNLGKFGCYAKGFPPETSVSLKPLADKNCYIGVVVDEVQRVFVVDEKLSWRITVMKSLEEFARTEMNHVYLVLSGTTADLASLLFRSMRPKRLRDFDFDLNASLVDRYFIPAYRTVSSLKSYVKIRYPSLVFSDFEICTMLIKTGGFGHFVHNYVNSTTIIQSKINYFSDRKAKLLSLYINFSNYYCIIVNFITSANSIFFNSLSTNSYEGFTGCPGVSLDKAIDVLDDLGQTDGLYIINNLVDEGLLYISPDGPLDSFYNLELSVSKDWLLLVNHSEKIGTNIEDYTLFVGLVLTVYGGIENDMVNDCFMKFVRVRLFRLDSRFCYRRRYLKIINQEIFIGSYDDTDYFKKIDLEALLEHELFGWEEGIGLDGVCVRLENDKNINNDNKNVHTNSETKNGCYSWCQKKKFPRIFVDGWRCSGGISDLTEGGETMGTFREALLQSGFVNKINDELLNGILAEAELGLLSLFHAFNNTIEQCTFYIGKLMITTSKHARTTMRKLKMNFTIPRSIPRIHVKYCSRLSYSVELYDKEQWFRDIMDVEEQFHSLLPPQVGTLH